MQDESAKRRRRVWTKEEDEKLKILVEEKKLKNWVMISSYFRNRSNKDCRDRYFLHLSPNVVKRKWTAEEEELLLEKYKEYGSKWVKLTSFFDKRSPNDLKNRIKLIQKRKKPLRKGFIPSNQPSTSDPSSPTYSPCTSISQLSDSFKVRITINSIPFKPNQEVSPLPFFDDLENLNFSNGNSSNYKFDLDKINPFISSLPSIFDYNSQEANTSNNNSFMNYIEPEFLSNNIFSQC